MSFRSVLRPKFRLPVQGLLYDLSILVSGGVIIDEAGQTIDQGSGVTISGSRMVFDATVGAYVRVAGAPASLGASDFTAEVLFRTDSLSGSRGIFGQRDSGTSSSNWGMAIYQSGTRIVVGVRNQAGSSNFTLMQTANGYMSTGVDYEVVVTRVGSAWTLTVNGTQLATATYSDTLDDATQGWNLGYFGSNQRLDGEVEYARLTIN